MCTAPRAVLDCKRVLDPPETEALPAVNSTTASIALRDEAPHASAQPLKTVVKSSMAEGIASSDLDVDDFSQRIAALQSALL